HDHKYDAIPTRDFYRLQAFFSTIQIPRPAPGDGFQIGGPLPATFYRKGEKDWAARRRSELEKEASTSKGELKKLEQQILSRLRHRAGSGFGIQALVPSVGNDFFYDVRPVNDGKLHYSVVNSDAKRWSFFTDGDAAQSAGSRSGTNRGLWFATLPKIEYATLGGYTNGSGDTSKLLAAHEGKFAEVLIYRKPLGAATRKHLAAYVNSKYTTGDGAVRAPPQEDLALWLDASDLDGNPESENPAVGAAVSTWIDKVAGLRFENSDTDQRPRLSTLGDAKAAAVEFRSDVLRAKIDRKLAFAKDASGAIVVVYSATHTGQGYGFEFGDGRRSFLSTFVDPAARQAKSLSRLLADRDSGVTKRERRRHRFLSSRDRYVKQHLRRLQPLAMSLRHSYGPPYEPGVPTTTVKVRGEWNQPGAAVVAGFPTCVTGKEEPAKINLDPFKRWPTRSRRLALANWIASPKNPLTARVMVNRLWHWHFGRGIVATPSDFGKLSGGPSHPELLDWLAVQFVKSGWKLKAMHRLMLNSAAYRQSSTETDARAEKLDPGNTLLWKFRRRRLEAEAVRDAILAVSGRLNPESYGLPIFPPLPEGIEEAVKWNESKWATDYGPEGRKRSVYIYQQRTLSMPFLQTFDSVVCDESRPRRGSSVTALQALAMYNGEFALEEAEYFAERVRKEAGDQPENQVRRAFRIAFSRAPTEVELAKMTKFIAERSKEDGDALIGLCRVLYNANEFVYVD
ncbi:MAG: DUF1553 domain-containing protein, partial [Planctomycetota bacterium]